MDCTFNTDYGKFNYRVGALIVNGRKILMARNPQEKRKFYYSVGGRVKVGEKLHSAVMRELKEETGINCEISNMFAIHENFFTDDDGIPFHEISVFFVITPSKELLQIKNGQKTLGGPNGEYLEWIDLDNSNNITIYPEFLRKVDLKSKEIYHFITE